MELRFGQHVPIKPVERVAKPSVPIIQAISRLPIPDFDPNWVPPGALERLRREQRRPREERPQPQLPLYEEPPPGWRPREEKAPAEERGVIIINMR